LKVSAASCRRTFPLRSRRQDAANTQVALSILGNFAALITVRGVGYVLEERAT